MHLRSYSLYIKKLFPGNSSSPKMGILPKQLVASLLLPIILFSPGEGSPMDYPSGTMFNVWSLSGVMDTVRAGGYELFANVPSESCARAVDSLSKEDWERMLDAWGKPGAGILDGNISYYGSYDKCESFENFNYCMLNLGESEISSVEFGVCVPNECNDEDVQFVFSHVLGILSVDVNITTSCPALTQQYSSGAIGMVIFLCLLGSCVLVATLSDLIMQYIDQIRVAQAANGMQSVNDELGNTKSDEKSPHLQGRDHKSKGTKYKAWLKKLKTFLKDILLAFSLYKTLPSILGTDQPASAIRCINGLRVLSMFWVIGGHTVYVSYLVFDNSFSSLKDITEEFLYQPILNGYNSVDSFFFLSGLLVSYLTMREMSRRKERGAKLANIFPFVTYYLHRILRLTPAYAFVVLIVWQLLPSLTMRDGPIFSQLVVPASKLCGQYWWTNLLYINNFYPTNFTDICARWTWYLGCDMQFFVISPVMLVPFFFSAPVGLLITGIILLGSFSSTAVLSGVYDLGVSSLTLRLQPNSTVGDYVNIYYSKPYCRIPPYLVGIVVGYMLYKGYKLPFKRIVNTLLYNGMIVFSLGLTTAVVYGIYELSHGHHYSIAEVISYNVLSRMTWGIALGLLVFVCHNKYGGWVDKILSWKFWIPLSRLTYLSYLIHPVILVLMIDELRTPIYYVNATVAVYMVSSIVLTYGVAALLAIMVEFPFSNIEAAVFKLVGVHLWKHKNTEASRETVNTT